MALFNIIFSTCLTYESKKETVFSARVYLLQGLISESKLIPSSVGSRARQGVLPLCSTLVRPPPGVLCPALEPSAQDRPGAGPKEAPAMIRGLEPLCCEERLGELGLFNLKRKLWGDLRASASAWSGLIRKMGTNILAGPIATEEGVTALKWKGRFRLDMRKNIFTMRVMKPWHRLPREVGDASSLESFKLRLDRALSNVIQLEMSLITAGGLD